MIKKIFALFLFLFLFFPPIILADERCPDYCERGVFYYGGTFLRECTYSGRTICDFGCDGSVCARPTPTIEPTAIPTRIPPTDVPPTAVPPTQVPPTNIPPTAIPLIRPTIQISSAPRPEDPSCENSCKNDTKYFDGIPNAQGTCVYKQEICKNSCSKTNINECELYFEIGPAYFADPYDNKLKSIPDALVEMAWIYTDKKTIVEPLPDRTTNIDGTITVSKSELYKYLNNNTAYLAVRVDLADFNKRFEILDASTGNKVPFLQKYIYVSKPTTYKIDFNFDVTQNDQRNAKIYYHNWEAVNFSENVLGTKIKLLLPESIVFNKTSGCTCHSSSMGVGSPLIDNGVSYPIASSNLINSNSPENLEWHEFCHHIMMDEFGYMPPWIPPCPCKTSGGGTTCNHCGYPNATSADAWIEGWAEYCAATIKDYYNYAFPEIYSTFGSLEVNFSVQNNEEFAVASTLWDLYDKEPKQVPGKKKFISDGVQLSALQIWNVLKGQYVFPNETKQRHVYNFQDIYWAFSQSGLQGLNDKSFSKKGGENKLDAIFITRNCFGDTNSNNKWNLLEPIGFTYSPVGTTNIRPNRPEKPGAFIAISLKDNNNLEIKDTKAKIKVTFQNDSCGLDEDCDYEYWAPIIEGKVYVEPPTKDFDATVEIDVYLEEKYLKLAKFTAKDYWQKYDPNKAFVQSYDLKVNDFQNISQSKVYLSDILTKITQKNIIVESSQLISLSYKIIGIKNVKLFRLIPIKMKVQMEIDSQTGNILKTNKPWWGFLTF